MKNSNAEITLRNYIEQHHLNSFAIACSAGIDSLSLLHAATKTHEPEKIYCLHYDHAVREDSADAASYLEQFCKLHNIKFYTERNENPAARDEESLRDQRYEFLTSSAKKLGIKSILIAHNQNDNAETLLFRLFRGTNTNGLAGIAVKRKLNDDITIHRPWLELSRTEIEAYARAEGLEHVEDSSNNDGRYARNHIRINILSQALKINPKATQNMNKLAKLVAEQNEYIELEAAKYAEIFNSEDPELNWDLGAFRALPRLMQRKLLERHFSNNISFTDDFLTAIAKGGFNRINFENGKYFCIRQKRIRLEQD